MRTEPRIDRQRLIDTLRHYYAVQVQSLVYAPGGEDAHGYIVSRGLARRLYLKLYVRQLEWDAVLIIPERLQQQPTNEPPFRGPLRAVVAPMRTVGGAYKVPFEGMTIAMFPYIEGTSAAEKPLTPTQLERFGHLLSEIHSRAGSIGIPCPEERYDTAPWRERFMKVLNALTAAAGDRAEARREAAALLLERRSALLAEFARFNEAAEAARAAGLPHVLCHGDPTMGNIIVSTTTGTGQLNLIDWDGVIIAPKERDLVHFDDEQRPHVLRGYGLEDRRGALDDRAVRYYRHQWNIQEIVDYGERLLLENHAAIQQAHDLSELRRFLAQSALAP
ncbi:MAG: phosphotransferase enzyme family protein [Chloroflexota bacterium]